MSFERFETSTANISALSDRPNDVEGMSAAALKAAFDKAGTDIKTYLNNVLLPALEEENAAGNLGIAAITGLAAMNVQAALEELYTDLQQATTGTIPDKSLTTIKYADRSVTGTIVALATLLTENYADKSVTGAKVADNTLETTNYKGRSITGPKIALAAITAELLANLAVTEPKMANGSVSTRTLAANAVTPEKTSGIQAQHIAVSVTVPAITAGGSVTVPVTGVTADNTVFAEAAAASWEKWRDCGVRCAGQSAGNLVFTAESATGESLTANVVILP